MLESFPNHVVIIPDGNRRWAKERGVVSVYGHIEGYTRLRELILYTKTSRVSYLTIWAFSTENWKRQQEEVVGIFNLIKRGLAEIHTLAKQEKTKVVHIGRRDRIPKDLLKSMDEVEEETKEYKDFCLCLAIDYGGEDEIIRAEAQVKESKNTDASIMDFLDTTRKGIPKPDLVIRTGGERRTSGFMPLQSCYAEYFFSELLFPDFTTEELRKALEDYSLRERRFGK